MYTRVDTERIVISTTHIRKWCTEMYPLLLKFLLRWIRLRKKSFYLVEFLAILGTARYNGMLNWIEIGLNADTTLQRI